MPTDALTYVKRVAGLGGASDVWYIWDKHGVVPQHAETRIPPHAAERNRLLPTEALAHMLGQSSDDPTAWALSPDTYTWQAEHGLASPPASVVDFIELDTIGPSRRLFGPMRTPNPAQPYSVTYDDLFVCNYSDVRPSQDIGQGLVQCDDAAFLADLADYWYPAPTQLVLYDHCMLPITTQAPTNPWALPCVLPRGYASQGNHRLILTATDTPILAVQSDVSARNGHLVELGATSPRLFSQFRVRLGSEGQSHFSLARRPATYGLVPRLQIAVESQTNPGGTYRAVARLYGDNIGGAADLLAEITLASGALVTNPIEPTLSYLPAQWITTPTESWSQWKGVCWVSYGMETYDASDVLNSGGLVWAPLIAVADDSQDIRYDVGWARCAHPYENLTDVDYIPSYVVQVGQMPE